MEIHVISELLVQLKTKSFLEESL